MKFSVSDTVIDVSAARKAVADKHCGALTVFEGWIRDHNEGQKVERLEYEVYRPVAEKEGARIIDDIGGQAPQALDAFIREHQTAFVAAEQVSS